LFALAGGVIPGGAGGALAGGVIPGGTEYFCKLTIYMLLAWVLLIILCQNPCQEHIFFYIAKYFLQKPMSNWLFSHIC
jgi:hypothetical protein